MDAGSRDKVTPLTRTEQAHQKYRQGQYQEALQLYCDALSIATLSAHRIALYSNRAACYLKLQKYKEAAAECSAILELDHSHKGALMLRAQTLVALKDYHSAVFDVNRLLTLNPTSEVYREFQARLRTQLALATIPEAENESLPPESPRVDQKPSLFESTDESHVAKNAPYSSLKAYSSRVAQQDGLAERSSIPLTSREESEIPQQEPSSANLRVQYFPRTTAAQTKVVSNAEGLAVPPQPCPPALPVSESKAVASKGAASLSEGRNAAPKPKAHAGVDYSRWNSVGDDLSDDEDDEDSEPQYRYRLRTIGLRAVNR